MELEDDSSTNFIPEHLLKILTAIESDGTHLPWRLIHNSSSFSLIVNFRAKGNDKGTIAFEETCFGCKFLESTYGFKILPMSG